ncbi:MAG: DUF2130 domain-containing protein [Proteobacteria bacterium]|nr:MAG: DUF2130 domain-containing protein [Pseudomonadota bacterium]
MNHAGNKIACPNCGVEIDVNDVLYHQVDAQLRRKYNDELAQERSNVQDEIDSLKVERKRLDTQKAQLDTKVSTAIKDRLVAEERRLRTSIKAELESARAEEFTLLQTELADKGAQLKAFNKTRAENERLKREKDELQEFLEAELEKKLNEMLTVEREKIRQREADRAQMKLAEREKVIEQLNVQLKDAQRKAEQGSMQLQGEVQELALEQWLANTFPLDTIEEIKKGARGADCLQIVNTRARQNCGTIYYESKRTKGFQPGWIEKFKHDIREKGADIGVLVTESMPSDMARLGLKDGVWICTFDDFKSLCLVLRESLIILSNAITAQDNKGDKMGMLYDFLTGNEFRLQVEAIVEGFTQMQTDLESEKRSMAGIWKKREKQIQKVLLNTTQMHGAIKGIAGSAIQSVSLLELPGDSETDL